VLLPEFPIPTPGSQPEGIAAGSDGNVWFTEIQGNKIGRITTTGIITEFSVPTPMALPWVIVSRPDGTLWFTENPGKIGKITSAGLITEFTVPFYSVPYRIALGPDGNIWFTDYYADQIVKMILPSISPTPVPSSLIMLCTGLAALIIWQGWRARFIGAA
jgi:virginiamycin B lyase